MIADYLGYSRGDRELSTGRDRELVILACNIWESEKLQLVTVYLVKLSRL
jgi:hypothetical protein